MKQQFEMTEDELKELYDACKPTPVMYLSGGTPMFNTPQENANHAWKKLADKYGFIWDSVEGVGSDQKQFLATPKPA